MRIKFLSVIVGFLIVSVSFAVSSCLDSDTTYEYSSDATIHAFAIDTIHGKNYAFTIDQLNRLIYNRDSFPMDADTLIDSILIKKIDVTGWITSGSTDTIFNTNNAVDLTPAMNNDGGMLFKVHAADGLTTREYKLKVNVHRQDPDSLVWTDMQEKGAVFSNAINPGEQKAVVLGDELFVYTSNATAYKTSTTPDRYKWSEITVAGLPADAKLTSAIEYKGSLFMVTENKKVFSSADGAAWTEVSTLGSNVVTLINGFSNRLSGIVEIGGKQYFNITDEDGKNWETVESQAGEFILEEVPAEFPTEHLSTTRATTGNGIEKVILVGMPLANPEKTTPWFSMDGKRWASLENTLYDTHCPGMENPTITYYADTYYCLGGALDNVYNSITGIVWSKIKTKFMLPSTFKEKGAYSIIVEPTKDKTVPAAQKRDFIWVIFGGNGTKNEVWRGRLNRLGFEIQ